MVATSSVTSERSSLDFYRLKYHRPSLHSFVPSLKRIFAFFWHRNDCRARRQTVLRKVVSPSSRHHT